MIDLVTYLYSQHTLIPSLHEIRLLQIEPGESGDGVQPIRCTLQVKSLDDNPEFEALSYVWGDPSTTRRIVVEGVTLGVTLNLFSALKCLKPGPGTSRCPLWVDAICINQRSVDEKNHQVPMMARIYRQAKNVIAWQGESKPSVALFLNLIVAIARDGPRESESYNQNALSNLNLNPLILSEADSLRVPSEELEGYPIFKELSIQIRLLQACLAADDGRRIVFENVYWTRIWTYQEYELPAAAPLCRYGNIAIRWEKLELSLAEGIETHLAGLIARTIIEISVALDALPWPFRDRASDILTNMGLEGAVARYMASMHRAQNAEGLVMRVRRRKVQEESTEYLSYHLWASNHCDYTDPRDRVYALHGLLPNLANTQPPDYNRDPSIVLVEAWAFDLQRYSKLLHLGLNYMPLRPRQLASNRPQQYPSWMPAVVAGSKRPPSLTLPVATQFPGGNGHLWSLLQRWAEDQSSRMDTPSIISDQHILKAPAIRLRGTTKSLVTFAGTVEQIQSQLISLIHHISTAQPFASLSDLNRRLLRCLSAYNVIVKEAEKVLVSAINAIFYCRNIRETSAALGLLIDEQVGMLLRDHTVFIFDEHTLGFGRDIRNGDTICIMPTIVFPFAICKEREDTELGTIWNMVEAVYLDGLMENKGLAKVMVDEVLKTSVEMLTFQ